MMDQNFAHTLIPMAGLAANMAVQMGLLAGRLSGVLRSIVLGFAAGLAAALGLDILAAHWFHESWGTLALNAALDLFVTGGLGYCWFHYVGLGETARRIRLLRELDMAPQGLTQEEILARYNAGAIVSKRLNRLLANHQVVLSEGRFTLRKSSLYFITKLVMAFKVVILGKNSEFG